MPTVTSSRALVPIGRRIRNAPEDSDASKAIVLRRKQQGETEDLSKALIIRPSDDGKDDRQALVLYRRRGAQEMLRQLVGWHKSSALLPPFRLQELIRIADSQFMASLRELQNLQDPLYFFDDIMETIEHTREYVLFKEHGGNDPLQNPQFVTSTIAIRIHNAYFRTAAWKYVRDHAKLLKDDLGLDDTNVFAQLKANGGIAATYLGIHEMLKHLEASSQKELGLLAASTKHYMQHVKEGPNGLVWDYAGGIKLHKSLVDTIIIEMVFPQARYELSILMLCLRDAIALGGDKKTDRFDQEVFDAIGDLSVVLQLLDMMETPISGAEAKSWRAEQTTNITDAFTGIFKSSVSAASHVAGIAQYVVPLTKTKTPATLEKLWDTINQTYVSRTGMDIDILWGLEDSMNPEPQWSAWALTSTRTGDEQADKDRRALVRKIRPRPYTEERKKRLAIANEPAAGDDEPPLLISDSEEEYTDDEEFSEEDEWSEDEAEPGEDEQNYWDTLVKNYQESEKAQASKERAKSPEAKGNPFKTLFRSLKGRFLGKDPVLSVEPQPTQPDFEDDDDEHDGETGKKKKKKKPKKKAGGAAGDDDLPGLLPAYPYKNAPPDLPALIPLSVANERLKAKQAQAPASKVEVQKPNVMLEELDDPEANKPEGSGGKKKKKKKKKAKKAGETEQPDEEDEEEAPRPATPPPAAAPAPTTSPSSAKSPKAKNPKSPLKSGGAAASMSSLYTPQPETAQSGLSYVKAEGISVKNKQKSRPDSKFDKLGSFMSRTFGRRREEEEEAAVPVEEQGKSGVAERLVSYMKSVKARAIPAWSKILNIDESKGQGGLSWHEFVKAMTDLGFEYDESSAGSRVRFDPPDRKDSSYTVHKPHPDPWLHPKRVKDIARDLKKLYGFDESMLTGLQGTA
ncbi:unnamed protein product [Rhizoctonia solani]|uniref:YcfA-like protein n=1 Tax=Rhizoctonia solani AG-3 Rhs1AP TaxID=1086054 RepID=A0A0A1UIF3_9AGAM|nr:YcfA-like protein [Rhizoctonia solani AG-3 Rhs1AP]CAE6497470.1 unnamed protein product [Rhizoctonia solani]